MTSHQPDPGIAVVIPCYRVGRSILDVLARIGPEVAAIYVVDDACPDNTASLVKAEVQDPRVRLIRHERNRGVGAATLTGMQAAAENGAAILIKIDGDGQMDPALIPLFAAPLIRGEADYAKGNRFFAPEDMRGMPLLRILGNGTLSFLTKLASGYWTIFDPTNGYVALHRAVFQLLPKDKIAERFFFESDLLFRLNLLRARVVDIPMRATYGDEVSNLRISRVVFPFAWRLLRNFFKRVIYSYFVRDFSVGSLYLLFGLPILLFGIFFGLVEWFSHAEAGAFASAGTVMLAALPIIVGFQLVLAFLTYDVGSVPVTAVHPKLVQPAPLPSRLR